MSDSIDCHARLSSSPSSALSSAGSAEAHVFAEEERDDWRDPLNDVPVPFAVTELGRQACARGVL
jgi:hypothetical protein